MTVFDVEFFFARFPKTSNSISIGKLDMISVGSLCSALDHSVASMQKLIVTYIPSLHGSTGSSGSSGSSGGVSLLVINVTVLGGCCSSPGHTSVKAPHKTLVSFSLSSVGSMRVETHSKSGHEDWMEMPYSS